MLILYILFCLYASICGIKEAILYGKQGAETFKWNEHLVFDIERLLVAGMLLFSLICLDFNFVDSVVVISCCTLAFSFFHDGFYYETARRINRPDYRFSSNSQTSTAKLELTWFVRGNMFILSLIGILIYKFIW